MSNEIPAADVEQYVQEPVEASLLRKRRLWVVGTGKQMIEDARSRRPVLTAAQELVKAVESSTDNKVLQSFLDTLLRDQFTRTIVAAGEESSHSLLAKEHLAELLPSSGPFSVDHRQVKKRTVEALPKNVIGKFLDEHPAIFPATVPILAALLGIGPAVGIILSYEVFKRLKKTHEIFRIMEDTVVVAWAMYQAEDGTHPHREDFEKRLAIAATIRYPDDALLDHIADNFSAWTVESFKKRK